MLRGGSEIRLRGTTFYVEPIGERSVYGLFATTGRSTIFQRYGELTIAHLTQRTQVTLTPDSGNPESFSCSSPAQRGGDQLQCGELTVQRVGGRQQLTLRGETYYVEQIG